ncbi:MAG: hypothetical protein MN733_07110 [Nitrososphaera sp.]|nr:hypothetical protein [Nitrososphaera sp.]
MHYFEVRLDYETSNRAGAGGMFQVISVRDSEGEDRTSLVDQGMHFDNLEALRQHLARQLNVAASDVELEEVAD